MKAYIEYEDSTFWAIRVEGGDCFTAHGSRNRKFWPEHMLKAGTEEEEYYKFAPNKKRVSFASPAEAANQAAKLIDGKSGGNERHGF